LLTYIGFFNALKDAMPKTAEVTAAYEKLLLAIVDPILQLG
jgi:hypothetical protein